MNQIEELLISNKNTALRYEKLINNMPHEEKVIPDSMSVFEVAVNRVPALKSLIGERIYNKIYNSSVFKLVISFTINSEYCYVDVIPFADNFIAYLGSEEESKLIDENTFIEYLKQLAKRERESLRNN